MTLYGDRFQVYAWQAYAKYKDKKVDSFMD